MAVTVLKPGLHKRVPFAKYAAWPLLNFHTLCKLDLSPAHAVDSLDSDYSSDSPAKRLGRAVHSYILEPRQFSKAFIVAPEMDRRTKEGKAAAEAFAATAAGREIITAADMETLRNCRRGVALNKAADELVRKPGLTEASIIWTEPETGIKCKSRVDKWCAYDGTLIDLKSTRCAAPVQFGRDAASYLYHAQLAFYRKAVESTGAAVNRVVIVAVETQRPFCAAAYEVQPEDLDLGWRRCREWLMRWRDCEQAKNFPGYSDQLEPLILPEWVRKQSADDLVLTMGGESVSI